MRRAIGNAGGERARVAEAEIEALACERMNGVGCIADKGEMGRNVGGGLAKAEGKGGQGSGLEGCDERRIRRAGGSVGEAPG